MSEDEITISETAQAEISGHLVGVGNIWERELPDETGAIAARLSARLSIFEIATEAHRHQTVFAGNLIILGEDRYQVVGVEEGDELGSITLRRTRGIPE
jgi:hypothetical protein